MAKHIPNILTLFRFVLVPVIAFFLFEENYITAIILIAISCFTDILDGYIARKFNFISDFGKLMDPVADKITQIVLLAVLVVQGIIHVWLLLVIVIKDFVMITGGFFFYAKDLVVSSNYLGKAATVCLYFAILLSMVTKQFSLNDFWNLYAYYLAIIVALIAFINYFKCYFKKMF